MAEVKDVTIQETPLIPAEVVENATTQAKLLIDIVNQTRCYQEIKGKRYLQVEAWETIGAFNRVHAETKEIKPITKRIPTGGKGEDIDFGDRIVGYEAHVQLFRDGSVVGGAIMPCYFTENCCKGKQGDEVHKACMSAAQTFATSKAYRMNYSYVAILAGYQPMPAEEVTEDTADDGHGDASILTNKYEGVKDASDTAWIHDALRILKWKDVGAYIKEHYPGTSGATIGEAIQNLAATQKQEFITELRRRLDTKVK
jgi:hypothetical protein